jgi:hypothetical protein
VSETGTPLAPPANETPLAPDGQHTQAWAAYHQSVSDALAAVHTGVVDGSNAVAGQVGEYLSATPGSAALSGAPIDVGTLSLTAGDWDVSGWVVISNSASALRIVEAWVNTASVTPNMATSVAVAANMGVMSLWAGTIRVSSASASTVYLGAACFATSGTTTASGFIQARRIR